MTTKPLPPLAEVLRAREQSLRVSQARCVSEVAGPRGEAQAMAYGFEAEEIRINLLPLAQEYDAELARLRALLREAHELIALSGPRCRDEGMEHQTLKLDLLRRIQEAAP